MKDNWFGDWVDIDVVQKDKYVLKLKRVKSRNEKIWTAKIEESKKECLEERKRK